MCAQPTNDDISVGNTVTHNGYGGEGIVIEVDKTGVKVEWKCDGPPNRQWHYKTAVTVTSK